MRFPRWFAALALLAAGCAPHSAGRDAAEPAAPAQWVLLHNLDSPAGLKGTGKAERSRDRAEGRGAVKWSVDAGRQHGLTFAFDGRGIEASDWGELRFRYKVLSDGWTWFGIKLVDFPLADGMQATWRIDGGEGLRPGGWREAVVDLTRVMYRWGEKPDRESQWLCFRAMADRPAAMLLDDVRLTRAALRTRTLGATSSLEADGTRSYAWNFEVANPTDAPCHVGVEVDARALKAFRPALSAEQLELAPGATAEVSLVLAASPASAASVGPLTSERAVVHFVARLGGRAFDYPLEVEAVTGLPRIEHPVLLLTRAQAEAVKKKAARCEWAKKAFDQLIAAADGWVKRKVTLPDRGGQWWHWYSCPKCGTRLKTLGPTRHQCPTCRKVYSGEPYDSVVLSRDHSRLARAAEDLGLAYLLTGNRPYAQKAAEILEAYAGRYLAYPRHNVRGQDRVGGGRVGPQTLDESTWLIPVVRGYDLVWDTLSAEQRARIEGKLLRPAAELIMEHRIDIHNIQCWKNSAVGLVGICIDEPRFLADAITSAHGIHEQLAQGILDDGFWYEGSWGYHYYTMSALVPLAEACRNVGIDVHDGRYGNFYAAPLNFALPDGRLPAFNDSHPASAHGPWTRYEVAFARWGRPAFAAMLKGRTRVSRESLLYGVPELPEEGALPSGSRNFPASGYAYLQADAGRNGPVAVLDYAPHGGGHGHPEKLQIVLYANGEVVAPDPGCIHYGVPLHREWYKQTVSHNTVVADGRSQKPCRGTLAWFHATPELATARASADGAYDGVRFTRSLVLLSGGLGVDLVELSAEKTHSFDWAFHAYGAFATPLPLDAGFEAPGKASGYQHIRQPRGCDAEGPVVASWVGAKTAVHLAMLGAKGTRVFAGEGYGQPASRKLPTLLVRRRAKEAVFASAFRISGKGGEPPQVVASARDGKSRFLIRTGDEQAAVEFPMALGGKLRVGAAPLPEELAFETDGVVAVARLTKGRLSALAFANGKRITLGEAAIRCSRRATVSLTCKPRGKSVLVVDAPKEVDIRLTGLFNEGCVVTRQDGTEVEAKWRRGTLSLDAAHGDYLIATK